MPNGWYGMPFHIVIIIVYITENYRVVVDFIDADDKNDSIYKMIRYLIPCNIFLCCLPYFVVILYLIASFFCRYNKNDLCLALPQQWERQKMEAT